MLAVVLAILAKLVTILKLGLRNIKKDNKYHIFKQLHSTLCFDSYISLCFKIIRKTNSKFDLKIKEAVDINWRKPNLNAQQNHLALTLSSIFYCLNYTSLLLHLFIRHLVIDFITI